MTSLVFHHGFPAGSFALTGATDHVTKSMVVYDWGMGERRLGRTQSRGPRAFSGGQIHLRHL